jgi:hypothetical protein
VSRLLALFIIGISPGLLWAGWHSQPIDTGGEVSVFSFSTSAEDHPYIGWYRDGIIKHLEYREEKSLSVIVASNTWLRDGDLKLTIGKSGQPGIVYCDENAKHLIYAQRENIAWIKTIIERKKKGYSLPPCAFISVAGQSSDIAEIAFKDENTGTLKYANFIGKKWATSNIDTGGQMTFPAITATPDGKPLVAYYDVAGKHLKFARFNGTKWSTSTVESGDIGKSIAVGFTNEHIPKICYFSLNQELTLKFAHWEGKGWRNLLPKCVTLAKEGTWKKSNLDLPETVIIGGTIALDKRGTPHIAYLSQSGDIVYAQETPSGWETQVIGHTDARSAPQMMLNSEDLPRILFTGKAGLEYLYFSR